MGYLSPPNVGDLTGPLDMSSGDLARLVEMALAEDLGQGDLTTSVTVPKAMRACGTFRSRTWWWRGYPWRRWRFKFSRPRREWSRVLEDGKDVAAEIC